MEGQKKIDELMKTAGREHDRQVKASGITKEFLIVAINDSLIGLHIEYLREVLDLADARDIIPLPYVPEYIQGVINVRGEIVPVLDLASILGLGGADQASPKIVIIDGRFKVAFLVREIIDMKTLDMKDWRAVQNARKKTEEQLVTQEFTYLDKTVGVIDVLKLYASKYLA
jgi:purine-binding chemotaxis protein CheW